MREDAFAVGDFEGLLDRVIPEFRGVQAREIAVLRGPVAAREGCGRQVVEGRVVDVVTVRGRDGGERREALVEVIAEKPHMPQELPLLMRAVIWELERFARHQQREVFRHDFVRLGLPVGALERVPDFFPLGDNLAASLGRSVVIDDVAVGREERGEDILVLLENRLHEAVGFVDEEAGRAGRAAVGVLVNAEAALRVLENAGRHRVAEKLAEEAVDARVTDDGANDFAAHAGVNLGGEVGLVAEESQDFALVILARGEPSLLGGLQQFRIRPAVAERVGKRVSALAGREHLPAKTVCRTRAEFQAVEKLRFQQHRQQHLPQALRIAANRDGLARQLRILR